MPAIGSRLFWMVSTKSSIRNHSYRDNKREDCFGVYTPYHEEKHNSNYLSSFGYDIGKGETVTVYLRMVVMSNPSDTVILEIADDAIIVEVSSILAKDVTYRPINEGPPPLVIIQGLIIN